MRLDKFISTYTQLTRSQAKKDLKRGLISVNGDIQTDGKFKVNPNEDQVEYRGQKVSAQDDFYYILNKPKGVVTANSDKMYRTVIDLISKEDFRNDLFAVGRLDKDTTGMLIITNNGTFAHNILAPGKHVSKTYQALVTGQITEKEIKLFKQGIILKDGTKLKPAELIIESYDKTSDTSNVKIIISEGKYHQIKRMFGSIGQKVLELHRLKIGELTLPNDLKVGKYQEINAVILERYFPNTL